MRYANAQQDIIEQTEALLEEWKHPEPYRPVSAPGGSKYQRNLPVPSTDRESFLHDLLRQEAGNKLERLVC